MLLQNVSYVFMFTIATHEMFSITKKGFSLVAASLRKIKYGLHSPSTEYRLNYRCIPMKLVAPFSSDKLH
jgi:hypothetical protein